MEQPGSLAEPSTAFNLMEMGAPKTLVAIALWLQMLKLHNVRHVPIYTSQGTVVLKKGVVSEVLLLGWCSDFEKVGPTNLFEIFSGVANTTRYW